eukprot:CAMPEP_0114991310 /NCGR_PEP_ID=MMETSP0216-20121206/11293_1 /TAXON_ID=223996 /ORGANISM="Protocruzia adherens, Strain Boccale" /LENGTH=295 /DNA_ID=CAMNT_0002354607 /DNA_START=174 /DNA_END=1057 /DNA_ORIENTATION=+
MNNNRYPAEVDYFAEEGEEIKESHTKQRQSRQVLNGYIHSNQNGPKNEKPTGIQIHNQIMAKRLTRFRSDLLTEKDTNKSPYCRSGQPNDPNSRRSASPWEAKRALLPRNTKLTANNVDLNHAGVPRKSSLTSGQRGGSDHYYHHRHDGKQPQTTAIAVDDDDDDENERYRQKLEQLQVEFYRQKQGHLRRINAKREKLLRYEQRIQRLKQENDYIKRKNHRQRQNLQNQISDQSNQSEGFNDPFFENSPLQGVNQAGGASGMNDFGDSLAVGQEGLRRLNRQLSDPLAESQYVA